MLLQNRYEYNPQHDFIADEASARIYKAIDNITNEWVYLKFYRLLGVNAPDFVASMEKNKTLQHPQIAKLHNYFELEGINEFGQPTQIRVGVWDAPSANNFEPENANTADTESVIKQLISGLEYLHLNQVHAANLSPENVLVFNNKLVIHNFESTSAVNFATNDFKDLGNVIYYYTTGNKNNDAKLAIPSNIREVYKVIIEKCWAQTGSHNSSHFAELSSLLDTYERNKLFEGVQALTQSQFDSRYTLLTEVNNNDTLTEFKAHDNFLDTNIILFIYTQTADLDTIKQLISNNLYFCKADISINNKPAQTTLIGVKVVSEQNLINNTTEQQLKSTATINTANIDAVLSAQNEVLTTTSESALEVLSELEENTEPDNNNLENSTHNIADSINKDAKNMQLLDDDEDILVSLNFPELDDEDIKPTEIIRREAISEVEEMLIKMKNKLG